MRITWHTAAAARGKETMGVALRYLTALLAFLIIALEVCFFFTADYHISNLTEDPKAASELEIGGVLVRSGGNQGEHGLRQQKSIRDDATTSNYTPDYTKFNTSHPPILYASSPGSLPSLPDLNRVPRHVLDTHNFTEHYANWDHEKDPHTLFVYNPSIVSLFSSTSAVPPLENIQYLATFRVSSIHSCGFPTYEFWKYGVDYVGLALMNGDLTIATVGDDSLDIIVDINAHLPKIYHGRLKVQDVRLFILHDRVFISSNVFLVPICVKVDGFSPGRGSVAICNDDDHTMEEISALYRKNDRLRLFVMGDAIRLKNADGKNFQFFTPSFPSSVLMEYWPMGPRIIHDYGDEMAKHYKEGGKNNSQQKMRVVDITRQREIKSDGAPEPISAVAKSLDSSLKTFIKRDRSSACCVQITKEYYGDMIPSKWKELDSILVGISHSKSRGRMPSSQGDRYNYLSRLYAFSSVEPYDLIARSGLFCFGFPDEHDAKSHGTGVGNKYNELTHGKMLELNGKTYNCPNIHFVDSIIEKADDQSKLVVSYGVNDCVPRFLEIAKKDFMMLM